MPVLALLLEQDSSGNKTDIVLNGSIPKQPLVLSMYQIQLPSAVSSLDRLHVKLPFLNDFDVNTNYEVSNAFPIFNRNTQQNTIRKCHYEFNPSQNIQQSISGNDWGLFQDDGSVYSNEVTVTLVFNYRRQELM